MDSFYQLLFLDIIKHILLIRIVPSIERPEVALGRAHSHARAHSRAHADSRARAHSNTGPPHFLRQLR